MAQSKWIVNYQTSQYELLNSFFYSSRLGVFQYARAILQVTLYLDHPVFRLALLARPCCAMFFIPVDISLVLALILLLRASGTFSVSTQPRENMILCSHSSPASIPSSQFSDCNAIPSNTWTASCGLLKACYDLRATSGICLKSCLIYGAIDISVMLPTPIARTVCLLPCMFLNPYLKNLVLLQKHLIITALHSIGSLTSCASSCKMKLALDTGSSKTRPSWDFAPCIELIWTPTSTPTALLTVGLCHCFWCNCDALGMRDISVTEFLFWYTSGLLFDSPSPSSFFLPPWLCSDCDPNRLKPSRPPAQRSFCRSVWHPELYRRW